MMMPEDLDDVRADLDNRGFATLRGVVPLDELAAYEGMVLAVYHMMASKLPEVRHRIDLLTEALGASARGNQLSADRWDAHRYVAAFELVDPEAGYQAILAQRLSPAAMHLATHPQLLWLAHALLACPEGVMTTYGPDFYPRLPRNERLMYHWHTERPYYPKREHFIKMWLPVFGPKTLTNGTMAMKVASHKTRPRPLLEFDGYRGAGGPKQMIVPESELDGLETEVITAERGDVVLLTPDVVHTSMVNETRWLSGVAVLLYFDPRRDLTLAADPTARFGADTYGRHDLTIREELR